jgi:hypothetical protein
MKRILLFVVSTVLLIVAPASAALGQAGYAPPPTGPQVAPQVIQAPRGLAFTGTEFGALILLAALALLVGAGLYAFGRRRARVAA